jgi:hypothetical protein
VYQGFGQEFGAHPGHFGMAPNITLGSMHDLSTECESPFAARQQFLRLSFRKPGGLGKRRLPA